VKSRREDDMPRDEALARAWREHVRETPPPAIDNAIRAAARREVGAKPRARVPLATKPWRWWMPMAAAATIGAIAIGVIQTLPQQALEPAIVSDATPPARAPQPASNATLRQPAAPAAGADARSEPPRTIAPRPAPASPAITQERSGARAPQAASAPTIASSAKEFVPDAPKPTEGRIALDAREAMPARTAESLRRDEARPAEAKAEAQGMAESAGMMAKRAAPAEADTAGARQAPSSPASPARERVAPAAPPTVAPAAAPAPRVADASRPALGAAATGAPARPFDDFVMEIRRRLATNDPEAAARELRAARAAHPDADARLPEDLRRWAAGVPR
jgi:hypothetical protein